MIRESPSFWCRRVPRTWGLRCYPLGGAPPADAPFAGLKVAIGLVTSCLLIPRETLLYPTFMAHSVQSTVEPESPHSIRRSAGVRASHRLRFSLWPKTAQNGPEWPAWPTHFLFGERPIFGPSGSSLTSVSDTKRPKMAQNGAKTKKLPRLNAPTECPEGRREPSGWRRRRVP